LQLEKRSDVVVLVGGRIVEQGPAHDVLTTPSHPRAAAFLGKHL